MICQALKKHAVRADGTPVPIDVHLMIQPVDALAQAVRQGRRRPDQLPPRRQHARRPHAAADQGRGLQGRPGVQPGRADRRAGVGDRQGRPGAGDERQPGLRRPELHPQRAAQDREAAQGDRRLRAATSASRSTAASRPTTSAPRPTPAPTPSWPAARSSARRTTRRRSPRCARRSRAEAPGTAARETSAAACAPMWAPARVTPARPHARRVCKVCRPSLD